MKITFFGTYDVTTTPRIQVLIEGLISHGFEVNECNVPLRLSTTQRVAILRQPWRLPVLAFKLIGCWLQMIRLSKKMPKPDAVIVGHLGQFDVRLARWLYPKKLIVLDYMISGSDTAQDRRASGGYKTKLLKWLDNNALRVSDIVIVDTEEHRQNLPAKYRSKGLVVLVGASKMWFDACAGRSVKPSNTPGVVFYGNFTPLQGAPIIGEAIALLETPMKITMIGTGQDYERTKKLAPGHNKQIEIEWIDRATPANLATIMAKNDICLGIFGTSPKAHKVVPNKVYHGAATGCALITSDTQPQRSVLGDNAILVPAGNAKKLARAIEDLATNTEKLESYKKLSRDLADKEFTPSKITKPLADILANRA